VVRESALRDDKVKTFFESMTIKLSERALGGKPIDIWLTDNVWERRTSISWESRPRELLFGKDNVTVRRGADDAHGKRLGELLQRMHYFEGTGSSVIFERHGRFLTTFVVDPAAMTDDVVAQFHWFAWRISKHVVEGSPVDVVLVDPAGKSLHRLSWDHRPQDPLVTTSGNEITRGEKCTEDDARNTAEVFATVLTAHPGVNVWIECLDRVGVTLQDKQPFEAAGVPVDALSKRFEDRPVDLFIVATEGDTTLEQRWEDRARKTKRKK